MDNLINRKVLVQYMIDHFRADWSFHDLLNAISQTPLQNAQQWIPIAERLPEEDTDYLVTMVVPGYFNGQPHTNWLCWYSDDHEWTDTDGDTIPEQETVVAWMPLPEPYRSAT